MSKSHYTPSDKEARRWVKGMKDGAQGSPKNGTRVAKEVDILSVSDDKPNLPKKR
jgi:hypothetical protein